MESKSATTVRKVNYNQAITRPSSLPDVVNQVEQCPQLHVRLVVYMFVAFVVMVALASAVAAVAH